MLALRGWNRELPRGSSVRIDVPASGWQLWVTYMFTNHPLSAIDPLGGIFPHPPLGRKADYVIALRTQPRPADAIGRPLLRNAQFQLWRMNPAVPGPTSRRAAADLRRLKHHDRRLSANHAAAPLRLRTTIPPPSSTIA